MEFQNLLLEEKEAGIYCLTINRPKAYNALNSQTLAEIQQVSDYLASRHNVRVLLLTGAGEKAFVAGADIKAMQNYTALQAMQFSQQGMDAFASLERLPFPVIAVVNGICLGGGCELAMSCDWIIAADTAQFGQPEVNLGVTPGFGGTQRLTRLIGRARALELLISGRQLNATEALNWGLVNHIYPHEQLMEEALKIARLIAQKGQIAIRLTKQLVQQGQALDLDKACLLETQTFGVAFSTQDQKEGMLAFMEKRSAQFIGS
jgi:enoyl-CoA hydratase